MRALFQRLRLVPHATFRPSFITPVLAAAVSQLKAGAFSAVDLQLSGLPAESLNALIRRLADLRGAGALARRWQQAAPHSRHATVLAAHVDIANAWKLRGEGYARHIPLLRRRRFPEVMLRGYQQLRDLLEQDPGNAMALTGLIHCNVVIGAGGDNRRRWLNQAMEAAPFHCPAILQYAQGTLQRWGGEDNERYHFANWVVEHAPPGSCALVIVADTVIDDAFMATDEVQDIRLLARCMADGDCAEWVRGALLKWLDLPADALPLQLQQVLETRGDSFHRACLERFALAAYFAGARPEARLLFSALRGQLQGREWEFFLPPLPVHLRGRGMQRLVMRRLHDTVCRDLELDLRQVCA